VYSSLAIPGVFPPVATDGGRLLVDGGVLDNLPVETMARTGEGPVIAVDVGVGVRGAPTPRAQRRRAAQLSRSMRRFLTGNEAQIPRLGETIVRTVMVGSSDTAAAARTHADLVITPDVEGIALMDWKAIDRSRELGRQAARAALEAAPDLHRALTI
jgi:NTE family protein